MDNYGASTSQHKVEILQREQVRIQGVIHVDSFDERQVVVETDMGFISLSGEEFHITSLDLEKGLMVLEGMLLGLEYSPPDRSRAQKERGLLQRLFR